MKIIFLDIDGVLNNAKWYKTDEFKSITNKDDDICHFDPKCVANLNKITSETNAKIVISSSWRMLKTREELVTLFERVGIKGEIIGETESLHYKDTFKPVPRGLEILKWIRDNHYKLRTGFENYIILDDDVDMLESQKEHFFNTNSEVGLTFEKIDEVIEFFNSSENI